MQIDKPDSAQIPAAIRFRPDDFMVEQYVANYDTINITSVDNIEAAIRLNRYIASIITDTSIALRLINDTDNRILDRLKYVWKSDTLDTMPIDTMYLISMCWVIQNHPDSLRYVFIRDINDPQDTTIVDTTVLATVPLQRIESWGLVDSTTIASNDWPFVAGAGALPSGLRVVGFRKIFYHSTGYLQTIADYWSRRRKFRFTARSLYHPYYCGKVKTDQKTDDIVLLFDVIGLLCRAQELGAFRNSFTVPLDVFNVETQTYQKIE